MYVLVARPVDWSDCRAIRVMQRIRSLPSACEGHEGAARALVGQENQVLLSGGPLLVVPTAAWKTLQWRASVEQRKRRTLQGNFVVTIQFLLTAYIRKSVNAQIKP